MLLHDRITQAKIIIVLKLYYLRQEDYDYATDSSKILL